MNADREDASATRRPTGNLAGLLRGAVGEPLTIANEFTEVLVRRVDTRNGSRLLITAPRSGTWITLDPLEVEALTWQNSRTLEAMVGMMNGPLLSDVAPPAEQGPP